MVNEDCNATASEASRSGASRSGEDGDPLGDNNGKETQGNTTNSPRGALPANMFPCGQCPKGFKNQNDAIRHKKSVHDRATPYFCHETGCRRKKGFSRKDNFEVHLLHVHGIQKSGSPSVSASNSANSHASPKIGDDQELTMRSLSRTRLIEMLLKERATALHEKQRREQVEEELRTLRGRYEERGDLLRLLMK